MKRTIVLFLLLIISLPLSAGDADVAGVQSCFDSFKKGIMEQSGDNIAGYIDKHSTSYCNALVEDSLYLPADKFNGLPIIEKYLIMRMNTTVPFGVLLKMHGREFLAYSVSNGWFNNKFIASVTISNISINGSAAFAEIYLDGKSTDVRYKFVKEEGSWKFVFLSHLAIINASMKNEQKKSGKSEDKYLKDLLQPIVNYSLDDYVFEPVLKK